MASENREVILILKNLIETCRDSENGFRAAAGSVRNEGLQTLLQSYARQHARYIAELQSEVRRFGGDPARIESIAKALWRDWTDTEAAMVGRDEDALLTECHHAADYAWSNYEQALETTLPADVKSLLQRHCAEVKAVHDHLRTLDKAAGKA